MIAYGSIAQILARGCDASVVKADGFGMNETGTEELFSQLRFRGAFLGVFSAERTFDGQQAHKGWG